MASEQQLRIEAVRRRLGGETAEAIAEDLGRTTRWVRKWVARHNEEGYAEDWSQDHSRAPHNSPSQTPELVRTQIIEARKRLVANPRAQYGSLAIAWELRRLGIDPIPPARTIERIVATAGPARPRRGGERYASKGVPYPVPVDGEPGTTHQIDMVGPRHLHGGIGFHVCNLIDVGSHRAASHIVDSTRPVLIAGGIAGMWTRSGIPRVAQFDNHTNFRGAIPTATNYRHFGPVVAMCLDLGITPRFIPLREPWRNGIIEHFNNVWDKSFFRTEIFTDLRHLSTENQAFIEFHNQYHRYSAHHGSTPNEIWQNRPPTLLDTDYQPPTSLPTRGRIEVIRYIRSNRRLGLFGKTIVLPEDQTHQYVTSIIRVSGTLQPESKIFMIEEIDAAMSDAHRTVSSKCQ